MYFSNLLLLERVYCRKLVERRQFLQFFPEADKVFHKIDHGLFAPTVIMISNAKTEKTFRAGKINPKVIAESLGF